MQKNAAAFTTICMLLCFAFNYTFPLHRQATRENCAYNNCTTSHWHNILDSFSHGRSKNIFPRKMDTNVIRIAKSTQHNNTGKGTKRDMDKKLNEEDLRQYEQLVIMKKYPYLDLKELEYKFSPLSNKNTRQSLNFPPNANFRSDISFEPDEGINVEIISRGLSGFSIPPKLAKTVAMLEDKLKLNGVKVEGDKWESLVKKKSSKRETRDLERYLKEYENKIKIK